MHFEEIWNEAEELSGKIDDRKLKDIALLIREKVDKLEEYGNLPKEQAINIGEILFELASVCNITELRNNKGVNVSAGLKATIENKKEELLDPE